MDRHTEPYVQSPELSFDAIHLLGVQVHLLTIHALVARIAEEAVARRRAIVAYANAHGLNLAFEQPKLRRFFNHRARWVFCDGFGVRWGARLTGQPAPHRYTPPDWIDLLARTCAEQGLSLFLLGGAPDTAARAARTMQGKHGNLRIAGTHHGFFDKRPESAENDAVLQCINAAAPDVLLVGFGMPAQEYWLDDNWERIAAPVAITVGALFDYLAGKTRRAPPWMTNHGLEWLGRLMAEPTRLWRRYLIGNPLFISRVLRQRLGWLTVDDR